MAAPVIPPVRLGLVGTGLAVEKLHWPTLRGLADRAALLARDDVDQAEAFLALAVGHPDRTFVAGENFFYRDDLRYARALLDGGGTGRLPLMTRRHAGRLVPREGRFTATPWRQRPAVPRRRAPRHPDPAALRRHRAHGAVQAANSAIEAPSGLALNLVFTGGAIGNYACPTPRSRCRRTQRRAAVRHRGRARTRRIIFGAAREAQQLRRTTHTTVFRGIDNGYRADSSTSPMPLPGQRISSSASFAA